jgi:AraC family transcriptional regulator of arabinose operon
MNARWGPGRRDKGIIHYVLSGKGFFNGNPVAENQGFFIEPNSFCEYVPDPADPWNYFWMDCSPEFAVVYGKTTLQLDANGIFFYDFRGQLLGIIDRIMSGTHTISSVEALGYAFSILAMHSPQQNISRGGQYVRQAKSYIESSIGKSLMVRDVAEAVSIHDRYLYNLFMQIEGISPKEYILRRKLETAEDLLAHTNLPVSEIAMAAGFTDVYSFSRLFKRKRGVSPSEYRNSVKKD